MKQKKLWEFWGKEKKKPEKIKIELNLPKTKIFINRYITAWGIVEEKIIKQQRLIKIQ